MHAALRQIVPLGLGFHTLGNQPDLELTGQRDDRVQHRPARRLLTDGADEGAIDLDAVDRQFLQHGQAALPSAEVIDRDAPTGGAQRRQCAGAVGVHELALGQLQQHLLARHRLGVEQRIELLRESGQPQLCRRQVDGEVHVRVRRGNRRQPVRSARHDQFRHSHNQAAAFGFFDEFTRGQRAALWVQPAHQHFSTGTAAGGQVDDGLHEGLELALAQAAFDAVMQARAQDGVTPHQDDRGAQRQGHGRPDHQQLLPRGGHHGVAPDVDLHDGGVALRSRHGTQFGHDRSVLARSQVCETAPLRRHQSQPRCMRGTR